jgi:flagellar FliL protein
MADEKDKLVAALKKQPNIFAVGIISFLVTVVVTGALLFITLGKFGSFKLATSPTVPVPATQPNKADELGPMIPVGNEIIVNILGADGSEHYVKLNVTLEVDSEKTKDDVTKRIPLIRNNIIDIMNSTTVEKIVEKEGKDLIRSEISKNINQQLTSGKVKNVFFEDFVVQ